MVFITVCFLICQVGTAASDEGGRADIETSAAAMDSDAMVATGGISQGSTPTPEENQKQSPETDIGQEDADAEADDGRNIDGEPDAQVDLDTVG